jgi:hypothetical protein
MRALPLLFAVVVAALPPQADAQRLSGLLGASGSSVFVEAKSACALACDGATDDAPALQGCLTANPGRTIVLPYTAAGCRIASPVTVTGQTLRGEGSPRPQYTGSTSWLLKNAADSSMVVLGNNGALENLRLVNNGTATSGRTISVVGSWANLRGVTVQAPGFAGGASHWDCLYVGTSVQLVAFNADDVQLRECKSSAVTFDGTAGFQNDHHLSRLLIDNGSVSPRGDGVVLRGRVEAVQLADSSILTTGRALYATAASYGNNLVPDFLLWVNTIIDTCVGDCVLLERASHMSFANLYVATASGVNIRVQQVEHVSIQGGESLNSAGAGMVLDGAFTAGYPKHVKVNGMLFAKNNVDGVSVTAGVSDWALQGNSFSNVAVNNGVGNQTTALRVAVGASDRYIFADNLLGTLAVTDGGSGVNKRVANNY